MLALTFILSLLSSSHAVDNDPSRECTNSSNPSCFYISPKVQVVSLGSYVTIRMGAGGEPKPTKDSIFWWSSNGLVPPRSPDQLSVFFKGIRASNAGLYRAFISNSVASKVIAHEIIVKDSRMSVMVIPKSTESVQGTTKEIQCSADQLNSQYMWLRDGSEIATADQSFSSRFSSYTNAEKSVLTIQRVENRDAGVYECRSWSDNAAGNTTATLFVKDAGEVPQVEMSPENATYYMQKTFNVQLRCTIPGDPRASFLYWEKDGRQIATTSRDGYEYEPSRSQLNIFGLSVQHSGIYTCVASLSNGIRVSKSTQLTIKPAITVSCTEDQFLALGADTTISCSVTGDTQPATFLHWIKGGRRIENSAKYRLSEDKSSLSVSDIQESDGGTYTVVIETSLGKEHETSSISVIMDPKILESPASLVVATGSDVTLSCVFSGNPRPYFFWNKDSEAVEIDADRRLSSDEEELGKIKWRNTLTVRGVSKLDAGIYAGFALNGNEDGTGIHSADATLEVIDPPAINVPPRNVSLTEGRSTTISCGYTGDGPIVVDWLYEGRPISSSNRVQLDGGSIKFTTSRSSDSGIYTCRVQNKVGVDSAVASLSVLVPPEITTKPVSVNLTRGHSVRLTCEASTGQPAPVISWRRDGQLQPKTPMPYSRDILEIENVEETAEYACMASNTAGQDMAVAIVAVKGAPEAPGLPIAIEKDKTSILLQWEPGHDGYSPIHHYAVLFKEEGQSWETFQTTTTTNELRVTGLEPYKTYVFKVTASNEIGVSSASTEARISTEQGVPSAPQDVQVTPVSSSSAEVTWNQPLDTQGILYGFDIDYRIRNSHSSTFETVATSSQRYTLTGLSKYTEYVVMVRARNSKGAGDSSQMAMFTTLEDSPGAPENLNVVPVTSSSLRLNWEQPLYPNGVIRHYKLYYQCTTSHDCPLSNKIVKSQSENPTYLLTDLHKSSEYKVYVAAVTGAGEGQPSSNRVATTLEDKPDGPPQSVHGEADSSTSILVSWAPPDKRHQCGIITKYRLMYKGLYSQAAPPVELSTITTFMLRNLTKYTDYSIQIEAATAKGFGPPSLPITVRTGEDVPEGRPVDVATNALSSTKINVAWRPPPLSTVHGVITGYRVEYRQPQESLLTVAVGADILTARLTGLEKGKNYFICVRVLNSRGPGPCAEAQQYTAPDLPSAPFIRFMTGGKRSIEVTWTVPAHANGEILGYIVIYYEKSESMNESYNNRTVGPNVLTCTIDKLRPWTEYIVRVAAKTQAGQGNFSDRQNPVRTAQEKPGSSITGLRGRPQNTTTIELTWGDPLLPNGVLTKFAFSLHDGQTTFDNVVVLAGAARVGTNKYQHALSGLQENTMYYIMGKAFNSEGESEWCDQIYVKTTIGAPTDVRFTVLSNTTLYISWTDPQGIEEEENYAYHAYLAGEFKGSDSRNTTSSFILLDNCQVGTTYTVRVSASVTLESGKVAEGPWSETNEFQHLGIDQELINVADVAPDLSEPGQISLNLKSLVPVALQKPGIKVRVVLVTVESNEVERKRKRRSSTVAYEGDVTDDVTLAGEPLTTGGSFALKFILLSPSNKVLYTSPLTDPITVQELEIVEGNTSKPAGKISPLLAAIFGVVPIVLILIIAIIVFIVRRAKRKKGYRGINNRSLMNEYEPMPTEMVEKLDPYFTSSCHPPITLGNLPSVYETLASNDFEGLIKEFESIEPSSMFECNVGKAPENNIKNRVEHILPYDNNRVKLEGGGSDYINASYIDGYNQKHAYIATQGPPPETIPAFWRMVWEQRTATIVMVTKTIENQSLLVCHQYWPNTRNQQRFGDLTVTAMDEVKLSDFTVRKFSLQYHTHFREVIQFQFTAWPDTGVPTYATSTLAFLRKVQLTNPDHAGPIVVHCTAGVGKTGTFITIDTMLRRIQRERDVDVYGCVSMLRSQRMQMVQSWQQYKFIFTALLEAIHCGNTEMRPSDIANRLESLSIVDSEDNTSGMEVEFKRLTIHYKYSKNLFTSANLSVNHSKNRFANVLPFENTRVRLQPIAGVDGSDYINASYITGYQKRNAYIATQGPLEETVNDFWRMIWEQNVNTIVMLTQIMECGRPGLSKCFEYWPSVAERPLRLSNNFLISYRQTSETQCFTRRELVLTNTATQQERIIQQYHFDTWPEQGLPQTPAIYSLVSTVAANTLQRTHEQSPVVVHCSAGGGRTGVFIAISIALERFQQEKLIDIFDLVKYLRNQRPAMVQTLEQYRFIYQVMAEYVESQMDNFGYF